MAEVWVVSRVGFEDFDLAGVFSSEDFAKTFAAREEHTLSWPYLRFEIEKLTVDAEHHL